MKIQLVQDIIDFIFPKTSIISGEILPENNSNNYFSDEELNNLMTVTSSDLFDFREKTIADDAFSLFAFFEDDDFSGIIYELKYGGMKKLGIFLGELLGSRLNNYLDECGDPYDIVIPVPLFTARIRERGYNQSAMICKGIEKATGIRSDDDVLKRTRHTSTQTKLSKEERMTNLMDAFKLRNGQEEKIRGKNVILVDDVVTTGSTLNEAIKILRKSNCNKILACTLAMAR